MDVVNGLLASVARVLSHDAYSSGEQEHSINHTAASPTSQHAAATAADDHAMEMDEVTFHWPADESDEMPALIVAEPADQLPTAVTAGHEVQQAAVPTATTLDDLALPLAVSHIPTCVNSPASLGSSKHSSSDSNAVNGHATTLLAPSTAVGHVSSQAALWSDGFSHARGQCTDCDIARHRQQELLMEQLVTVYQCNDCDNGENVTMSDKSGSQFCCVTAAMKHALSSYFHPTLIPLIASYAPAFPTHSFITQSLSPASDKLLQCMVERTVNVGGKALTNATRYEMKLQLRNNDSLQALHDRMFVAELSSVTLSDTSHVRPQAVTVGAAGQTNTINPLVIAAPPRFTTKLTAFGRQLQNKLINAYSREAVEHAVAALFALEDIPLLQSVSRSKWRLTQLSIAHAHTPVRSVESSAIAILNSNFSGTSYVINNGSAASLTAQGNSTSVATRNSVPRSLSTIVATTVAHSKQTVSAVPRSASSTNVTKSSIRSSVSYQADRLQIGAISFSHYERSGGPRKLSMTLLQPTLSTTTSTAMQQVAPQYQQYAYENIRPVWHDDIAAHVLHFHSNRVREKSVKNLKLVPVAATTTTYDSVQPATEPVPFAVAVNANVTVAGPTAATELHASTILQFGRERQRNLFILDFKHPLSPVQALCVAMSSIDCRL